MFARSCRGGALRGSALWRETNRLELMQRSMAFAALALVTLAPLMLVAGDFDPFQRRFPEWIVDGMGLPARTAPPVQRLFAAPTQVQGAAGVVGFVASVLFGMSFASAVQGVYLRIWGLPTSSWRDNWWRQLVWLVVLVFFLAAVVESGALLRHGWGDSVERVALLGVAGVLFVWWAEHFLLAGRASWRALLPGAVATVVGLAGLRVFSAFVFDPMIVSNLEDYGVLGVVIVIESWLTGVGFVCFGGALIGHQMRSARG